MKSWSETDINYLKNFFHNTDNKTIAKHLNRTISSINGKASLLGLHKEIQADKIKINDKFHELTVIAKNVPFHDKSHIKCQCSCGKELYIFAHHLLSDEVKSCGHIKEKNSLLNFVGKNNKRFTGYEEIGGSFWAGIKSRAKKRNLIFNITIKDAWELFLKQGRKCAITGVLISFRTRSQKYDGTASLDRIDSKRGYEIDNIQWVHKDINKLKMDRTEPELIDLCNKVIDYHHKLLQFNTPKEDLENIAKTLEIDNKVFEGKTILLTGAAGFLGRLFQSYFKYLNDNILTIPCNVICIDNYIVNNYITTFQVPNFTYFKHNICHPFDKPEILELKPNYIINCAGIASPKLYLAYPLETMDVSYLGTKTILDYALDVRANAVLCFSSSEIYGDPPNDNIPTKEDYVGQIRTMDTRSPYDIGKLMLETLCYIYTKRGVNTRIIRPFNVFGYIPQSDGRVIPNMISNVLKGEKIKIYGNGEQTRTFCWFTDFLIGAIKVLLHGSNKPYNIGNEQNEISMYNLGKIIEKVTQKPNLVELIDVPDVYKHEPRRRCPDITKARTELGYNPQVSVEEGISKFYNWALINYKY